MKLDGVAVVVLLAASVCAQENAPHTRQEGAPVRHRPRIGLVLEGGGALGLAHVGVLQWLEENRIPVDVIAGTSMGGLIGGVYATGEPPDQIRKMIRGIKWNEVLRGVTPYKNLSFRRKEDRREYPNAFEFGLKHGAQFPSGFSSGQQVGLILDRVGLPYSEMRSFDDLPIPFRCVATDLVAQKAYVFDHGSLALALRATMSLPAFFSPVRDGDRVLVDGGLLDNLPVDVARQMGADIVIAVHLKTKPVNPKEPMSSVGVLQRSASVTIAINELRSMEKADIVLTADMGNFDAADYPRFAEIEAEGYRAAQEKHAVLAGLQIGADEWQQLQTALTKRRRQVPTPQFVDVTGASDSIARGLEHRLAGLAGEPVKEDAVDQQMMNITGLGRFSRAGYAIREQNGQPGLAVDAEEKEYAPPTVHPQLLIDGSDYKNVLFQVGGRITFLDFGGFGSEWRNDFVAGSEYGLSTEYYHPFTAYTHWFISMYGMADSSPFNVYQRNRVLGEYRNRRMGGGVDLGYAFGRSGELRVGYQAGYQKVSEDIGVPVTPAVHGRFGITSLRYRLERFDDPVIPRSGVRVESTFKFYDANPGTADVVPTEELRFGLAQRTSERSSVLFFASGGTAFSTKNVGFPPFSLGGPLRLGAYGTNELLTNQYFLFQPALLYRLRELSPLLKQNLYLFSMYEAGKAYGQPTGVPRIQQNGTIGVLFQTVFGPMFFGGSLGDTQHRKFYFKVGKFF
ncbi:MAG: patatin-like phospholipase family protein [Acidobacteriia bacterium]|nr:patatin-like phospholipase family protein [Terriglobia bacterium]